MKKIKIDVMIHNFAELGAQRVAINFANELNSRGYNVRMIVNEDKGKFRSYLNSAVPIYDLTPKLLNFPKIRVILRVLNYYLLIFNEKKILSISFCPSTNLTVLIAKINIRLKSIVQEHAFQSVALQDSDTYNFFNRIYHEKLLFKLYRYSDYFVTITEAIKLDFEKKEYVASDRSLVIRNPVDITNILYCSHQEIKFSFEKNLKYLIGVGRLEPQKNFKRLIRIFFKVLKYVKDCRLIIVGSGSQSDALSMYAKELGIEKVVYLVGFQENPYNWMSNSTIFCLTSNWEGLPQVIAEAMICRVPIIANDCPSGPSEMIQHNQTGILVERDNEEQFVTEVVQLLDDDQKKASIMNNAFSHANSNYSLNHFINEYEKLISKINYEF